MRPTSFAVTALSAVLCGALASGAQAQGVFAFTDVTVVPMDDERLIEDQTVVVQDGRIVEIGPASRVAVPPEATRIDGSGKYLMPGLAEMHGHLPTQANDFRDNVLFLYVANGVTTVRGMQGAPAQIRARDLIARRDLLGPRLYVSSPAMTGNRVGSVDEAERLVRDYKAAGYDHLKVHEGLSREVYHTIARTAREVGIPFAGHVTNTVTAFEAMDAGQATIDHLDNMLEAIDNHGSRIPELIRAVADHGTGVVPTEVLWETAFLTPPPPDQLVQARTEIQYMPPVWIERWTTSQKDRHENFGPADVAERERIVALRRKLIKELYDGGALLLLGTDSPQIFSVPGFSIHREMRLMVEAGLSPYEVLVTGTRNIATYFGTSDDTGTVTVGKRADLILLNANPLADIGNVRRRAGVMVNGQWLPESEIRVRLQEIAERYR